MTSRSLILLVSPTFLRRCHLFGVHCSQPSYLSFHSGFVDHVVKEANNGHSDQAHYDANDLECVDGLRCENDSKYYLQGYLDRDHGVYGTSNAFVNGVSNVESAEFKQEASQAAEQNVTPSDSDILAEPD